MVVREPPCAENRTQLCLKSSLGAAGPLGIGFEAAFEPEWLGLRGTNVLEGASIGSSGEPERAQRWN